MTALPDYIKEDHLVALSKYLRLTNYLAAAQLYLKDNFFLEEELKKEHIKERILGHWGTVPGINFVYATLNLVLQHYQQEMMLIVGPGHGYPALLANLYVEGSFEEYYPEYKFGKESFGKLIRNFSWPGGFPSHANPETPGVILEGGELGYSLSTAFGAAMDNPGLIVPCIVGDGEAETGPTATAWHSTKFLDPRRDGAVLPIVHINQYKISGPTIYGTMDNEELDHLFRGYGYEPIIVEGDMLYEPMLEALDRSVLMIKKIKSEADENPGRPKYPVILLRTKKGWTGPKELDGLPIEDSFRSHGIPLEHVHEEDKEFQLLKQWLESYKVRELITDDYQLTEELKSIIPDARLRLGMTKHANGGSVMKDLILPELNDFEVKNAVSEPVSNTNQMGKYLTEILVKNPDNFRVMSPDETESNKLHSLFEVTTRGYKWPTPYGSENIAPAGKVMEMLSEHTLQGWLQGYVLTGRHGIFISYEAFMMIIASMVDQYSKFLKQMDSIKWRKPLPSLNFVLTSTTWRQDHNGYSHQNPGFISSVLNDYANNVNVHFPVDANTLVATIKDCFQTHNSINVIVAGKRPLPQYLSMAQAEDQITKGVQYWEGYGNEDENPDIVFAASGDYATFETMAAIKILKEIAPKLKTRFVSITELTCFGIGDNRNSCKVNLSDFHGIFTQDKHIIYNYHGYPEDIKHLIYNHPDAPRFHIRGYIERGTTTTPFDMQVQNRTSRYHLALDAILYASFSNPHILKRKPELEEYFNGILDKHHDYIRENGVDLPEVTNFSL